MRQQNQWEPWDPFGELNGAARRAQIEMERAGNWRIHTMTGSGDPRYFDYPSWIKGREAYHAAVEESQRERAR